MNLRTFPALGFLFGFQMPNSDQARGIGTNQIDLFSKVIVQKTYGREAGKDPKLKLFGNLGLGIMSAPLSTAFLKTMSYCTELPEFTV